MRKDDYIILNTSDVDVAKKLILDYFTDSNIGHDGTKIELSKHSKKEEILIKFIEPVLNELFLFFFTSIICGETMEKKGFIGWFSVSDNITFAKENGDFCLKLKDDKFRSRVVLNHVDVDYTLGFSDQSKRIEFYYDGVFKTQDSHGFIEEYLDETNFDLLEKIVLDPTESELDKLNIFNSFWNDLAIRIGRLFRSSK